MSRIDLDRFLTIDQFIEQVGCSRRAAFRALKRSRDEGKNLTVKILGRTLIPKGMVAALEAYWQPFGSERRSEAAKAYGAMGGTQKRINREKAARAAKRSAAGGGVSRVARAAE